MLYEFHLNKKLKKKGIICFIFRDVIFSFIRLLLLLCNLRGSSSTFCLNDLFQAFGPGIVSI